MTSHPLSGRTALQALVWIALTALPLPAAIVHVDIANETGVEDGSPANPYNTIQEGIDNASSGDRVQVAAGLYKETLLMRDGVSVLGSGAPYTIIDGLDQNNSVVSFNGTRQSPILADFTITGGKGDQIGSIGGTPVFVGGGVLILQSSPVLLRNIIQGNVIDQGYALGGGVYIDSLLSSPLLQDNVIADNVAASVAVPGSGEGGGIYVASKSGGATLVGNRILRNRAVNGGGINVQNLSDGTVEIRKNVIRDNEALVGGGIFSHDEPGSTTTVENNLIAGNGNVVLDPLARGGGIRSSATGSGTFFLRANTLADNRALGGTGGGIWLDDSLSLGGSLLANTILAFNTADNGGGVDHTLFSGEIRSNQLFSNPGGDLHDAGGSGATLLDNLFTDPLFRAPLDGNYQLGPGSPSIDSGDDSLAPAEDLAGFGRPFDGEASGTPQSDRGAFEYPSAAIDSLGVPDASTVSWTALPLQSGFHLYRGSLSRLLTTGEYTQDPVLEPLAARFCGLVPADEPWTDALVPPTGEGMFYLVSLSLNGWEGYLGESSAGHLRQNTHPCP